MYKLVIFKEEIIEVKNTKWWNNIAYILNSATWRSNSGCEYLYKKNVSLRIVNFLAHKKYMKEHPEKNKK